VLSGKKLLNETKNHNASIIELLHVLLLISVNIQFI